MDAVVTVYMGSCRDCLSNSLSETGSTDRTNCHCNVGYSGPDGGPCAHCTVATFKDVTGSSVCTDCPEPKTSLIASDEAADCKCPAAVYDVDPGGMNVSACLPCPNKTYAFYGSIGVASCTCNIGYTGPDGGPCVACPPGRYKDITLPGSSSCDTCPAFSKSYGASVACSCMKGFTGPLGGPCERCAPGTYKDTEGSEPCSACSPNSHSGESAFSCTCNSGCVSACSISCVTVKDPCMHGICTA